MKYTPPTLCKEESVIVSVDYKTKNKNITSKIYPLVLAIILLFSLGLSLLVVNIIYYKKPNDKAENRYIPLIENKNDKLYSIFDYSKQFKDLMAVIENDSENFDLTTFINTEKIKDRIIKNETLIIKRKNYLYDNLNILNNEIEYRDRGGEIFVNILFCYNNLILEIKYLLNEIIDYTKHSCGNKETRDILKFRLLAVKKYVRLIIESTTIFYKNGGNFINKVYNDLNTPKYEQDIAETISTMTINSINSLGKELIKSSYELSDPNIKPKYKNEFLVTSVFIDMIEFHIPFLVFYLDKDNNVVAFRRHVHEGMVLVINMNVKDTFECQLIYSLMYGTIVENKNIFIFKNNKEGIIARETIEDKNIRFQHYLNGIYYRIYPNLE